MHDTLKTLKYRFESYIPANVLSFEKGGLEPRGMEGLAT